MTEIEKLLDELKEAKNKVLKAVDNFDKELEGLSDGELIYIANQIGFEDGIVKDDEGGLANRDEVIEAIKEQEGLK